MFWKVIDKNRFEILEKVVQSICIKDYYMAGGTALAIQTGIRESFDFDFFVQKEFDKEDLINKLNKIGNLEVISVREGTLHCLLDKVQLTFLFFPNPLVDTLIKIEEIPNLYLASVKDIAVMKLIAISQRGAKKDFFDLYYICNKFSFSIEEILNLLKLKYEASKINYAHVIQSLSYFEDAEDEILPKVFIEYDWEVIKEYYLKQQKQIYENT